MYVPLTHFGEAAATGPAVLGISLQAFVIQLLTFLVVFLALKKWAFTPIIKMLNNRRDIIENGVTLGEKMRAEEAKAEEEVARRLHEVRAQADQLIAEAETKAKQKITAAEEVAQKRAEGIVQEANEHIKQATELERARLEKEIVGLASAVSEAIIREKVDATNNASLLDRALKRQKPT